MAKGNMVLTLVAQTKKWASGLKQASKDVRTWGSVVKSVTKAVAGAFLGIVGSLLLFLPNFIKMGEEARKSERRLLNIAENTGLFEKNLEGVTKRISTYAEELSFLTGIDDELIRENEAVLLTFKDLAKSADEIGGPFDRAVVALLDLQAAGKKISAVQLGKALQDPINNMTALKKAGILLTDEQKDLIATYMEANDILGAQDVLLSAIEDQVGGTAEATASATEKMSARFEDVLETLSDALLPAVDDIATAMGDWLDSDAGKKTIDELTDSLKEFGDWITSADGKESVDKLVESFAIMGDTLVAVIDAMKWITQWLAGASPEKLKESADYWETVGGKQDPRAGDYYVPYGGNAPRSANKSQSPIVVNFNTPVDSVSAGREIARVLSDYDRARGTR